MNQSTNNGPQTALEAEARSLSLSQKVQSLRLADKMGGEGGVSRGALWFMIALTVLLGAGLAYNYVTTQAALGKIDELEKKAAAAAKKDEDDGGDSSAAPVEEGPRKDEISI